jgi:hypothetical protein
VGLAVEHDCLSAGGNDVEVSKKTPNSLVVLAWDLSAW